MGLILIVEPMAQQRFVIRVGFKVRPWGQSTQLNLYIQGGSPWQILYNYRS